MEFKSKHFKLNYTLFCLVALVLFFCNQVFAHVNHQNASLNNFLVITDIHLLSSTAHSMEINPSGADVINNMDSITFPTLLQNISAGIQRGVVQKPQFIIFLGDMVGNYLGVFDSTVQIANQKVVFTELQTKFPGIPIFYVFGNHDSTYALNGPFYNTDQSVQYNSPYQVAQAVGWTDGFLSTGTQCTAGSAFVQPCIITESTQYGYYSAYIQNKLRLIVLNTVMLMPNAIGTTTDGVNAQFNWLTEQLKSAKYSGESVLLAMHVPFGNMLQNATPINYLMSGYNDSFLAIIANYTDTIIGMVGGHEHLEELKILTYSGVPVNFLINVASMVTYNGNASSFDTVYFTNTSGNWVITDYDAFNFLATGPTLQQIYSFNSAYCGGLSTSILNCFQQISTQNLVNTMDLYHTAGNPNYSLAIAYPDNIFTALPTSTSPNSGNGFGAAAAIIAGIAAVIGVGALMI
jgi:alkaline phosphatase D